MEQGGFYFTRHDHEQLIHRPKPGPDNATPSGNGVAVYVLQRLGHVLGEPRFLEVRSEHLPCFILPWLDNLSATPSYSLACKNTCLHPLSWWCAARKRT